MAADDLPLFAWKPAPPPRRLIVFPLVHRVGKIRDVAAKMLSKTTTRHADAYRDQVTTALLTNLTRLGIAEQEQDEHLGAFWESVQAEMLRLTYCGRGTGDAA